MIEGIIEWSIRNRFLVILASVVIGVAGVRALMTMPVDAIPDLGEMALGLWEGLRNEELENRYCSAGRLFLDDPTGVHAPEGDEFQEYASRVQTAMARIAAKFEGLAVQPSRGGYILTERRSDTPVARLKPFQKIDRFELFYWSLVNEHWKTFGPLGPMKLTLDEAHEIVHAEPALPLQAQELVGGGVKVGHWSGGDLRLRAE